MAATAATCRPGYQTDAQARPPRLDHSTDFLMRSVHSGDPQGRLAELETMATAARAPLVVVVQVVATAAAAVAWEVAQVEAVVAAARGIDR